MDEIFGSHQGFFVLLTLLSLFASYLTAQKMAQGWRSYGLCAFYGFLLVLGHRFLSFALAEADLTSLNGFIVSFIILEGLTLILFSWARRKKYQKQYPFMDNPLAQ